MQNWKNAITLQKKVETTLMMSMAMVPQSPPKWQTTWGLSPCAALTYPHAQHLKIFRILLCPGFLVVLQRYAATLCSNSVFLYTKSMASPGYKRQSVFNHPPYCSIGVGIFKWHLSRFLSTTILLISRDHLLPETERVQRLLCSMVHSSFHRRVSCLVLRDAATVAVCLFQAVPLGSTSNHVTM